MKKTQLDSTAAFLYWWRTLYPSVIVPAFEVEYRFSPPRRWRFDVAWPNSLVAVELEGGTWSNGRHTRGAGYEKDLEKYNQATVLGWRVLRFTPQMVARDPDGIIKMVYAVLAEGKNK